MSEWQPIETHPKTDEAFLLYVPYNRCTFAVVQEYGKFFWWGPTINIKFPYKATLWTSLPVPPRKQS